MYLIILSFVVLDACIAAWCGDLTWDSWVYLGMAESIKSSGLPTFGGYYDAYSPAGYPLLLALTSPHLPFVETIVSSKLANAALAMLGYLSLRKIGAAPVAAGLALLNPLSFYFISMTWSEIAFIASLLLLVCGMKQYHEQKKARYLVMILGAATMGFASRYVFGILLPIVGLLYVLTFGRRSLLPLLLVLLVAAALFGAELMTNMILTGTATGHRGASDTSTGLQLNYLITASIACGKSAGAWVLGAIVLGVWPRASRWSMLIAAIAVSYLLLMLLLRGLYQFDNLDMRLVGPAWILLGSAFAIAVREEEIRLPRPLLVSSLLLAGAIAEIERHGAIISDLNRRQLLTTSAVAAVRNYLTPDTPWQGYKAVVYLDIPRVPARPSLQPHPYIAFGGVPSFAPVDFRTRGESETLDGLIARAGIGRMRREDCVVVFTPYGSVADLDRTLNGTFRIAADKAEYLYAPDIREAFARIFVPGRLVPCSELLTAAPVENGPKQEDRASSPG